MTFAPPTHSVTLNSFQGPFLRANRSTARQNDGAAGTTTRVAERNARWMLKQVQHDGEGAK